MSDTPTSTARPYADRNHPGNRIRPRLRCLGCRELGCITAWGQWCLKCNVERLDRIGGSLNKIAASYGIEER